MIFVVTLKNLWIILSNIEWLYNYFIMFLICLFIPHFSNSARKWSDNSQMAFGNLVSEW